MTVFVDTSAFYAAADTSDSSNKRAKAVLSAADALVTSDHVLVESWILIRHRVGRTAAERFWGAVRSGAATIESIGMADLEVAWSISEDFPDQDFSIVDRTSFALMMRLGVHRAATFDSDFAIFRFGPGRRRAFEILA